MGASQVVSAQGALHGDEGVNSTLGVHMAGAAGDALTWPCRQVTYPDITMTQWWQLQCSGGICAEAARCASNSGSGSVKRGGG
jgi:hypothetical protein